MEQCLHSASMGDSETFVHCLTSLRKNVFSELFTLISSVFTFLDGHYKAVHLNRVSESPIEAE